MTVVIDGTLGVDTIQANTVTSAKIVDGTIQPVDVSGFNALGNYANDAAAQAGGVSVGSFYRNGSVVQVRVA